MNPYQPGEDNQDPYEVGYKAGAASRDAEIACLQSRIDEFMLEYCPDEMTKEQLDSWAKHQRAVQENELPESLRKP